MPIGGYRLAVAWGRYPRRHGSRGERIEGVRPDFAMSATSDDMAAGERDEPLLAARGARIEFVWQTDRERHGAAAGEATAAPMGARRVLPVRRQDTQGAVAVLRLAR